MRHRKKEGLSVKIDDLKKICVVGAGNMGHQISLVCALAGFQTVCTDISEEQLNKARGFAAQYLPERVAKGKLTQEAAEAAKANLRFTSDLKNAVNDVDYVIEAAIEQLHIKRSLFAKLDELAPPHAVLATNSSYIVSSKVADVTSRPAKVCNMHFFNPALVMKCVEVVKGPHTSEDTAEITMELARRLQKKPVLLHKEIRGFLVNRILSVLSREAMSLYDLGVASFEDIDSAVENALGHPMGPFRLMDLTGIDLAYLSRMEGYAETMNPGDMPSPCVVAKYAKGEYGRKTGKGFYSYS